ncbi:band 7 protein AGAP004871-like isoform X1 [Tigriopus californicus]|uniref:band 7 protein AGAP004871-like isoform X1 n=1 Tax=Tigriopus californicus TaxID=6832 RepID=UPI0027DA0936|nr:band 7 protein AGAP004871-like isoform X1 [Tigriopus californicus]
MIPIVELPLSIGDLSRVASANLDLDEPNPPLKHSQSSLTQTTFIPSNYSLDKPLQAGSPNRLGSQIGGTSSRRMTMEFRGHPDEDQYQDYHYHSQQHQQQQPPLPPQSNRRWPVQASNEGTMASMKNGHWGHFRQADPEGPGLCALILTAFAALLLVITLPFSLCTCIKVVTEYERAVIFRLGRLRKGGAKGPGIFFIIPCTDSYQKVDLRTVSFDVPPQEVLSRDSVTVSVDAVVYYRVSNPTMATNNIEDYSHSTRLLAATTLRNVLGTKNLAEILSERESISHVMQTSLDDATDPWGVKVERVEIKDVRLPVQLQRAMAAEAEAAREARAKVIAAEGEQKASKALREAADTIADSHSALQLRYLQTLNSISAEKNSTIIFPFPMELVSQWGIKPTNSKAIASS